MEPRSHLVRHPNAAAQCGVPRQAWLPVRSCAGVSCALSQLKSPTYRCATFAVALSCGEASPSPTPRRPAPKLRQARLPPLRLGVVYLKGESTSWGQSLVDASRQTSSVMVWGGGGAYLISLLAAPYRLRGASAGLASAAVRLCTCLSAPRPLWAALGHRSLGRTRAKSAGVTSLTLGEEHVPQCGAHSCCARLRRRMHGSCLASSSAHVTATWLGWGRLTLRLFKAWGCSGQRGGVAHPGACPLGPVSPAPASVKAPRACTLSPCKSSSSCCCFCFFASGSVGEDVVFGSGNAAGELDNAGSAASGGWSGGWRCGQLQGLLRLKVILSGLLGSRNKSAFRRCINSKRNRHNLSRCLNWTHKRLSLCTCPNNSWWISNGRCSRSAWLCWHWLILCSVFIIIIIIIIILVQCLNNRRSQ